MGQLIQDNCRPFYAQQVFSDFSAYCSSSSTARSARQVHSGLGAATSKQKVVPLEADYLSWHATSRYRRIKPISDKLEGSEKNGRRTMKDHNNAQCTGL